MASSLLTTETLRGEQKGFMSLLKKAYSRPTPLQVADHVGDTTKADLLREVMVLTKMNWNSANVCGLEPITLRFSRLVGDVLREVPNDREPQPKYKFYM